MPQGRLRWGDFQGVVFLLQKRPDRAANKIGARKLLADSQAGCRMG